jgi:hypothetical protein
MEVGHFSLTADGTTTDTVYVVAQPPAAPPLTRLIFSPPRSSPSKLEYKRSLKSSLLGDSTNAKILAFKDRPPAPKVRPPKDKKKKRRKRRKKNFRKGKIMQNKDTQLTFF